MPDKFRLSDLDLDEISVCPEGDNDMAKVALAKAAPKTGDGSGGTKHHKDGWENKPHKAQIEDGKCKLCDGAAEADQHKVKKSFKEWLLDVIKDAPDDDMSETTEPGTDTLDKNNPRREGTLPEIKKEEEIVAGLPEEAKAMFEKMRQERDEAIAKAKEAESEVEEETETSKSVEEVLAKADPAVRSLIEKMQSDTAEAQRIANEERETRINREMLAKAAEYRNIVGTDAEKAEMLKEAYSVSEEFGKKFEQSWKATNAQLDEAHGNLFHTVGKSGSGDITISSEVESKAAELRKADPTLTKEQAIAKVYESDPKLYEQSVQEG